MLTFWRPGEWTDAPRLLALDNSVAKLFGHASLLIHSNNHKKLLPRVVRTQAQRGGVQKVPNISNRPSGGTLSRTLKKILYLTFFEFRSTGRHTQKLSIASIIAVKLATVVFFARHRKNNYDFSSSHMGRFSRKNGAEIF